MLIKIFNLTKNCYIKNSKVKNASRFKTINKKLRSQILILLKILSDNIKNI